MGEGKSRWWWKSLNKRTKLAYWRREAREGILNGAWEEEGRGVRNLLASLMAKSWTDSSERVSVGEEVSNYADEVYKYITKFSLIYL